ncbi:MAG: hypothetical protein KC427_09550 [Sulfurovum sp.]|uniref:porin n=1 Tax=Sulfurovum sp. TaxID=1969726 RepID=UPI002867E2C6|nr:porin [Sulfurovum sp.]MCO4846249.1 hypothetical protein [Sulfurovum sp.]
MRKITTAMSLVAMMALGAQAASLEERVKALEEQNTVLTEEVLASQSGGFTLVDTKKSYNGMGPAASKVYFSKNPLSIGGYGEMYYANPEDGDDYADVYRFITYFGYKFNDWIVLNTEIEFEHGADSNNGGKVVVEFLYLDFLLSEQANLRLGHVLTPMGLVNLRHEPTLFNTVQRPDIEKHLLPSTWHENGALVYGRFDSADIDYTVGMINALNLNNKYTTASDDTQSKWIRSGRLGSNEKASFEPAFVGRVDYTGINGLMVGASVYYGDGSNLKDDAANDVSGLTTTMFDIHARYDNGPFSAYGLYTQTNLDGAEKLVDIDNNPVEKASGYYVNASYDISSLVGLEYKLPVFAQYQDFNPVEKTVNGGPIEDEFQTEIVTIGLNFFPADQVVLKADYAMKEEGNKEENIFSFGLGFIF